ncbi:response regulator [Candidatus Woesearchaeota archaeon]|nr:response regulator [Candidatus Woesearchaeota archaeon]
MKRALLAEDDESMSRITIAFLELFDYKVNYCMNGQTALEHCLGEKYDLIMSDNQMPIKTGLEFLRDIRNTDNLNQNTPFLLYSGNLMNDKNYLELEKRKAAFLLKPFEIKFMQVGIEAAISLIKDDFSEKICEGKFTQGSEDKLCMLPYECEHFRTKNGMKICNYSQ